MYLLVGNHALSSGEIWLLVGKFPPLESILKDHIVALKLKKEMVKFFWFSNSNEKYFNARQK